MGWGEQATRLLALVVEFYKSYNSANAGGMAEWTMAAVLKTVTRKGRGFESLSLRQFLSVFARRPVLERP